MNNTKTINVRSSWLYIGMLSLAGLMAIFGAWAWVPVNLCLALVFDPFDTNVPFSKRPVWQRVILVLHLVTIVLAILWLWLS